MSCVSRRAGTTPRRRPGLVVTALAALTGSVVSVAASPATAGALTRDRGATLSVPGGAQWLGTLSSPQTLSGEVALSPRDPPALDAFVTAVTTPGSPSYRQFLARGQFGPRFGASPSTVDAVRSWLDGAGLSVTGVDPDGLFVRFSGPAWRVESALGVSVGRYEFQGVAGYAASGTPLVPAALEGAVQGIIGLSNLVPVHDHVLGAGSGASLPGPRTAAPVPHISGTSCQQQTNPPSWTPAQVASSYGLDPLYTQGRNASGVTVALFELESYSPSDIAAYQSCYGTHATVLPVPVYGGPGSGAGDDPEAALDIEDVIGLAPDATVEVYEGPDYKSGNPSQADIDGIYQQIAQDDTAQVVSTSWGQCEGVLGTNELRAQQTVFEQMLVQGQNVFAASGDSGSEDCYGSAVTTELWVDDPASQPDVIGVGGTLLSSDAPRAESVWNDCQGMSPLCAYEDTFVTGYLGGAGGGGESALWGEPSWQEPAAGASAARQVPDVSASASPWHGYPIYWSGSWQAVGGTSAAVVTWAAVAALVDQGCAGSLSPSALYGAAGSGAFNDVTSGNNDFTDTNSGQYGAGPGYDMATGLGTPNAAALLDAVQPGGACPTAPGPSGKGLPVVAVQGQGDAVDVYWQAINAQWYGPYGLGGNGSSQSAPSVAVSPVGLPTVAVEGPGGSLDVYWEAANAQWYGPLGVGGYGSTTGAPAIAIGPSGLPTVAVQGPGGALWVYWEASNAQWYGPLGVGGGGSSESTPSIAIGPSGLPTVAVQGPSNSTFVYWEAANAQWYGPLGVGTWGSTDSAPSIAIGPSGLPTVAVQGPSNSTFVYWEAANAQWYGPLGVGTWGSTDSAPSIAIGPSGLPTVAVQGPSNSTFVYWEAANAQWYGPLGVGTWGSTEASPRIAMGSTGLPTVAVEGSEGSLDVYWEAANAQWYGPLGLAGAGATSSAPSIAVS